MNSRLGLYKIPYFDMITHLALHSDSVLAESVVTATSFIVDSELIPFKDFSYCLKI